ncbi:unnamed protein product, partial [marine sediment metagenome]
DNGLVYKDYGQSMYFIAVGGATLLGITIFNLVRSLWASRDPEFRNRVSYLLVGVSLLVISGAVWKIMPTQTWAIDHSGNLGNALILTYVLITFHSVSMPSVSRKGMEL